MTDAPQHEPVQTLREREGLPAALRAYADDIEVVAGKGAVASKDMREAANLIASLTDEETVERCMTEIRKQRQDERNGPVFSWDQVENGIRAAFTAGLGEPRQ